MLKGSRTALKPSSRKRRMMFTKSAPPTRSCISRHVDYKKQGENASMVGARASWTCLARSDDEFKTRLLVGWYENTYDKCLQHAHQW